MKKHYTPLIVLLLFVLNFGVSAQITTLPAAVGTNVSICQNGSVVFSSTNTPPAGATISWSFPGGTPSSANTLGPHPVAYTTPGTYVATLTVNGSSSTVNVIVAASTAAPGLTLNANLFQFGYGQTSILNPDPEFYYCGNLNGAYNGNVPFQFVLNPVYPNDHQIIVNWGDGLHNTYAGNTTSFSHVYNCTSQTEFVMSVLIVGPSGCVAAGVYDVYSGISPQISVSGNASTHCIPDPYTFTFNTNNVPGTTYSYQFSDPTGASVEVIGPFPALISYEFSENSCEFVSQITVPGGTQSFNNSFAGNIIGSNVCGESFLSIGPIYVSQEPVPAITISPEIGYACVGETVTISNDSEFGVMVGASLCNEFNKFCYNITPNNGWQLESGNMGDCSDPIWFDWDDADMDIEVTFQDFGTYYIELVQANACGTVSIMDSICIVAPIEANFTTNVITGCTPLTIHTTTDSYTPSCIANDAVYSWGILSNSLGTCPNEGLFPSYVFGTNNSSFEPSYLFEYPGIFSINLFASLTNPIPGTLCDADTFSVQVIVSQGPNMTFEPYSVCENDNIQLTNSVEDCYAQNTTFDWSFTAPPASIGTSNQQEPTLSFSDSGTFPISVQVTNECGTENFPSSVIVYPSPVVQITGDAALCVNLPANLTANITGPASAGTWTVSPAVGTLTPSGLTASYIPQSNYTGTLVFTFVTTDAPAECGQVTATFNLTYENDAVADAGLDLNVCQNSSVLLNGSIGGAATSLTWTSNSGGVFSDPSSASSTFTPPAGFLGSIVLTITTDDPPGACLQDFDQVTLAVVEPPTIAISSATELCQGESIPISATATGFQSGVAWTSLDGSFPLGANLNSTNFAPTPSFNGLASVTVTTTGASPCPDASETITITVHPAPFVANEVLTICSQGNFNFTPSTNPPNSVPANTQYTWVAVPNANISGASSQPTAVNSINQSLTNISVPAVVATQVYQIQPIATSALNCAGVPFTLSVEVLPTPSFTSPGLLEFCSDDIAVVNFVGVGNTFNWLHTNEDIGNPALSLTGQGNLNFPTAAVLTTETSTFTVTPQFVQNNVTCTGTPGSFDLSVISAPVTNQLDDLVFCNGASVGPINFTSPSPGAVFDWVHSGDAIGSAVNGTGNSLSFTATNSTNPVTSEGTITVTANFNGCTGIPMSFNVDVYPTVAVTNTQNSQSVCTGGSSTAVNWISNTPASLPTSYAWTIVNTGSSISGFTAFGDGSLPAFGPLNLPSGATTPGQLVVTVTPSVNNCPGTPFTYTINVNPLPVMPAVASQTICGGLTFSTPLFESNIPGTVFNWNLLNPLLVPTTISGYPVGGTGVLSGVPVGNSGALPYTLQYEIIPSALGCPGSPQIFSLTVNPAPTVEFNLPNQTICSGDETLPVTLSSNTPSVNITWNLTAIPPLTSGFNVTSGSTTIPAFTLGNLPPSVTEITATFQAIATTSGVNSCPGQVSNYTITINPNPTVNTLDNLLVCHNQELPDVNFSGTGNGYDWVVTGDNIGLISDTGLFIPSFVASNPLPSNTSITGNVLVTPIFTGNNVDCPGSTTNFSITVNPSGQVNGISDITVCNNTTVPTINFTTNNTGGTTSYSWVNTAQNVGFGSSANGVNSIPLFSAINTPPLLSTANVIVTPTFTSGAVQCPGVADTFQVNVIPTPTITSVSNQVYCNGDVTNAINFSGTATNFNWSYIPSPNIGLTPTGGTGPIPSFTAINTAPIPVSVNVTATPLFETNNVICSGIATNFDITVNTTPLVNQVPNIVVCNGEPVASVVFTGIAEVFSWTVTGPNIGITGSDTGNLPSFTAQTGTATVCVVPQYTAAGLICYGDTMCFQITVNPTPVVNPISNITICSEFNQPSIVFSGTGTSYEWETTLPQVVGLATDGGLGTIPSFISVATPIEVSNQIEVTPFFTGNGLTCSGATVSFGILVLRKPVVDQLPDLEICNALCEDPIPFTGTGSSYVWSNSNTFIGVPGAGSGVEFPSFCATNTAPFTSISGLINYHPTYTENNVTCSGDTLEFLITVNPTPNVNPIDDVILCDGTNSTLINISGNATTYSWVIDNPSVGIGLPPSGSDIIPSFSGFNGTDDVTHEAQIVITPFFIGGGLDCPGVNTTVNVIINPIPSIIPVVDQTLCFASASSEVVFDGTGTSYNWSVFGNPSIGIVPTTGTDILPVFISQNPTAAPISNLIEATPVFTTGNVSCFGTPTDFEIFVLPNPTISQVAAASVCNQEPTLPVNYSGTYTSNTWSIAPNPTLGINLPIPGDDDLQSFTWTNSDNATPQAATITATPFYTFNGLTCEGTTMVHAISVLPTTVVTPLDDLIFCNGDISSQFPILATGTELEWTSSPAVGLAPFGNTYSIPTFTATNTSTVPSAPSIVSTVTITPSYTDNLGLICTGTPSDFTITVHPTPVITPVSNYTVCNFGTVFQELETNVPSNISWSASPNAFITGETNTVVPSDIINEGLTNISPAPGTPQQTTYTVNAVSSPQGCAAAPMSFVINLMPTVTMSSTDFVQICNGNQVGLVLSANVASNFEWFGTGPSIGISNFDQTSPVINDLLFNSTGFNDINTYIVTPTSIDGSCVGVDQTIQVIVTPPPALISPPAASICSGQVVNYQFAANTSSTFTWFGQGNANVDGVTQVVIQNPFITDTLINTTSGAQVVTYNVVITAIGSGNCSSGQIPVYITVQPLPVVVPEVKEICPDETVTFTLQASEPSFFTWWADNNLDVFGETTIQTQSNFISNTLSHDLYDLQYVYYNVTPTSLSTGCVGLTIQHTAIVNPLPNLSFTTSDILCTENPVTYTIVPTYPLNVLWNFGNLDQSNQLIATTYYEEPGEYVVTLYGINPQTGCEDIVFVTIPILEAPEVGFITSSTQECVPAFFQFTDTADNPGSILTWNFGDGTTSNEQGVADHYYQDAGCFDVSLTAVAPNGCPNTITYEEMVCAYNIPIAGFIVNDPIQYGDVNEFLFENLTVFGHTYFWDFGDGSTTTNAVHPGHIYPIERNIYNVTLVATNEAGCSDTTMYSIQVQERLIFYVPNSFTPDGNTRNEIFQPVLTSGYDIYSYELMIFNRWGEPMFESYNDKVGWDGTYGGQVMHDGTYVWRIRFKLLDDDDFQEYYGHVNLLK